MFLQGGSWQTSKITVGKRNLWKEPQEILLFSVQKHSLALRSAFLNPADLFPYHSLTGSTQQEWRAGQRREGRGSSCVFCIFPAVGPEYFNRVPVETRREKKWFSLGLISFLLLPVRRRCDCLLDSLKTRRRTSSRKSLLQAGSRAVFHHRTC